MATRFNVTPAIGETMASCGQATWQTAVRQMLIVFGCVTLAACGFYSADPITARVVDAESGQGISEANVVVGWEIYGGLENGNVEGYVKVMETVTDGSGTFHFPGWGPRLNMHPGLVRNHTAPAIMVFKSGYAYRAVGNKGDAGVPAPSQMKSDWNEKTIEITRASSQEPTKQNRSPFLDTDVSNLKNTEFAVDIPRFLCAWAIQQDDTNSHNDPHGLYKVAELRSRGIDCNRFREVQ
jgi:hypothetical protein